ncbi:MAG: transcription antitermination factor NusB [Oscillospiraceae bacterium]|nr:transcription antitermination factor NusB [Oscillospiraceae bacterium]
MKISRNKAREQAFLILFQKAFDREATLAELAEKGISQGYITEDDFTYQLCDLAFEKMTEIDGIMAKNTEKWNFDRISKVAISVLRLAITEIKYMEDIPLRVSINEAIELTKKFSGEEEAGFVNGILAGIVRGSKKA